jgi:obg-like ATPase 1
LGLVLLQVTFFHSKSKAPGSWLQSHLWAPRCKTPPTTPLTFSFSSLIPIFCRPAASTARTFSPSPNPAFARKLCITFTTVRTYASAKKQKMPPKKAVKEEKVLLGRPGNSLKSGIVSESPALPCRHVLTLTVVARSA